MNAPIEPRTATLAAGERRDPQLRERIASALWMQERGWLTGRPGGRPWTLSRSKRLFDASAALLLLILCAPLMLAIALLVRLSSPGPVLFVQPRTGFRGRRFNIFKFRSMVADAEAQKSAVQHLNKHGSASIDFKAEHDPRVTPIGRWLRRTSLDELPNLINVVRGEMRLVGPRPTSFNASRYHDHHLGRLSIYPGITGLWQVSGRSDIDFDGRVELDMEYIRRQGPLLDLLILLQTPVEVFRGHGAS